MRTRYIFLLLVIYSLLSCSMATATEQHNNRSKPALLASLPDNPCELISPAQVSAISGLEVNSVKRVPSIAKIDSAQIENREPGPGTICVYVTRSEFGDIMIAVTPRTERSAAKYWEARAKYFETFPGSAEDVADLGMDAWLSGGTGLSVLVRGDEYFGLLTQMYQPRSRELLVKIAHGVLANSSRARRGW
jgi:hypothetical protein